MVSDERGCLCNGPIWVESNNLEEGRKRKRLIKLLFAFITHYVQSPMVAKV